jgi:hypothetical protein
MLEDECNLPQPSDANLVARLFGAHGAHACLHQPARPAPRGRAPRFVVAHFAGAVEYDSTCAPLLRQRSTAHPTAPLAPLAEQPATHATPRHIAPRTPTTLCLFARSRR